jgi:hypothetical protein
VVSSPLKSLFENSVEGSPVPAVSVIVFPPDTLTNDSMAHRYPVYVIPHSSDAGECPVGQCAYPISYSPLNALNDDPTYEYLSTLSEFH